MIGKHYRIADRVPVCSEGGRVLMGAAHAGRWVPPTLAGHLQMS